jgi:D-alanine transaminase
MPRTAYVNGQYVPLGEAAVHVEDRGYQFADGVYEVIAFQRGQLIDEAAHLDRLQRSLGELSIRMPMARPALSLVMRQLLRKNGLGEGILYLQITRGVARRDHAFPRNALPGVVMTVRRSRKASPEGVAKGVKVITVPDIRWRRADIKSIALLPNVLAKQQAREAGAYEAWLVDDEGQVGEGSSTNAWIVAPSGELVTAPADHRILDGITRRVVMSLAAGAGLVVRERRFTVTEAKAAREAFITSTTSLVMPVVAIDGVAVGDGKPGPTTLDLRRRCVEEVAKATAGGGR